MSSKVAPGMEISFQVLFSPEAKIDYAYDLNVVTEREKFIVPIRAIGCKAVLDFPDSLDFGRVPVKHEIKKPVVISNIGEKATKWQLSLPGTCFTANKMEGILEIGQSEQLVFQFCPQEARGYTEAMTLSYDGLDAEVSIKGESYEAEVYLSQQVLTMKATYIGLTYYDYVELINNSSVPVEFSWRTAKSEKEEKDKKDQLIQKLQSDEAANKVILEEAQFEESEEDSLDSDDSYDEDELNKKRERKIKKKKEVVTRTYTSLKAALAQDVLLFRDESATFKIEPLTGIVYPKSKVTISVSFSPEFASEAAVEAFCNVTCTEKRLHLQLYGRGLGPEANISPPCWRLNDISVNEKVTQDIKIYNQGQIPFDFIIKPNNTAFGRLFNFDVREGHLDTIPPNNEKIIPVTFESSKVGDFAERFEIQLGKNVDPLIFTCEGKVIAPPMKFEEAELDFKRVPFGFDEFKDVYLHNLSSVEIPFEVEIPDESEKKTFVAENVPKIIGKKEKAKIRVKFCPQREGEFTASLTVKVPNVAQDFATLPLKGVCQRPTVDIKPSDVLDFEQVFLRNPKAKEIILTNTSDLKAKFQIIDQEESSKRLAVFTAIPPKGEIEPHSKREISVKMEAETRGPIEVPMYVSVSSKAAPERIRIKADVLGPQVSVDVPLIDFKDVTVLEKSHGKFTIHNNSEIPAKYTAFTREKNSVFQVEQRTGILQPDEKKELTVVCYPDDAQMFEDTLYIDICEGLHSEVKLRARALGTSIRVPGYEVDVTEVSNKKITMYKVNFGTQYINYEAIKTINVENRGKKRQIIKFDNYPPLKIPKAQKKDAKKEEKKEAKKEVKKSRPATSQAAGNSPDSKKQPLTIEDEESLAFHIDKPEEEKGIKGVILEPQHAFTLNCRAKSKMPQENRIEKFKFTSYFEGTRKEEDIFVVMFVGSFVVPTLSYSEAKLFFKYIWRGEDKQEPIVKDLKITCNCEDPTKGASFRLNVPVPYRIKGAVEKMTLMPGDSQNIQVEFDPSGIEGRESKTVPGNLEILFDKDKGAGPARLVPLEAALCYPNLEVTPAALEFGSILIDTGKKRHMTLKNISELPVKYYWEFVEETTDVIMEEQEEEVKKSTRRHTKNKPKVNEVYDILPISGMLEPGEMETVEVTFHAIVREPPKASARCIVEGGPSYTVSFQGDCDDIVPKVDDKEIDFGEVPYDEERTANFEIENKGKVPFNFFVSLEKVTRPNMFTIEPQSKAVTNQPVKVEIKLKPGIPDEISEDLLVYCAHMPPKVVHVKAIGIFPFLIFSTHRQDKEIFTKKVEEVQKLNDKYSPCLPAKQDIHSLLLKKPENTQRSQATNIVRPQLAELEAEVDRRELCKSLESKYHVGMMEKTHAAGAKKNKVEVVVAKYVYDFGDLAATTRTQLIPFYNLGKAVANITVNTKEGKDLVSLDRYKLGPLESGNLKFNLNTQKIKPKSGSGEVRIPVYIEVRGGPAYQIDFRVNIAIPELSYSQDTINFGDVLIGHRKTITIRLENKKEVECIWSFAIKEDVASTTRDKKDALPVFSLSQYSGKLLRGQKQNLEIIFVPQSKKDYELKLQPTIDKNKGPKAGLKIMGKGIEMAMSVDKKELTLGPQLPYVLPEKYAKIRLNNDCTIPIEVYSVEFDKTFLLEEKMLLRYPKFETQKIIPVSVRQPGGEFWKPIAEAYQRSVREKERTAKLEELKQKLGAGNFEEISEEELKKNIEELEQEKLRDEALAMSEKVIVPKVHEDKKVNVAIFGWDKAGKTTLCNHLMETKKRGIIQMSKLVQWNMERNNEVGQKAKAFLEEKQKELEIAKTELEKQKKKLKKGEQPPVINEAEYKYLPKKMLVEMLENRIKEEDCNAGSIFDDLKGENYPEEIDALDIISEAIGKQHLHVIMLQIPPPSAQPPIEEKKIEEIKEEKKEEKKVEAKKDIKKEDKKQDAKKEDKKAEAKKEDKKQDAKKEEKKVEAKKDVKKGESKKIEENDEDTEQKEEKKIEEVVPQEPKYKEKVWTEEEKKIYMDLYKKVEEKMAELTLRALASQQGKPYIPPAKKIEEPKEEKKEEKKEVKKEAKKDAKKEVKKEEKKDAKKEQKKEIPVEPPKEEKKEELPPEPIKLLGERIAVPLEMIYIPEKMCALVAERIPAPEYPDPTKEPLPPTKVEKLLAKPKAKRQIAPPISQFVILTPKIKEQVKENKENNPPNDENDDKENKEEGGNKESDMEYEEKTRWIIPPKGFQEIYIKFYSEKTGEFKQPLHFEMVGWDRASEVSLLGKCEYPQLNDKPKIVFSLYDRKGTKNAPNLKRYDKQKGCFDFGPLLISKEFDKRNTEKCQVNFAELFMSNAGSYPLHLDLALKSQSAEFPSDIKSPFFIEPTSIDIPVKNEYEQKIKIWAFPDKPIEFKDTLIAIIKDNPKPVQFNLVCHGSQPTSKIDSDNIEFERLLVGQSSTRELTITNTSKIPIVWKLEGVDKLPKNFTVEPSEGTEPLKPSENSVVKITFNASEQQKYEQEISLVVKDKETQELKEDPKPIKLFAKAYVITVMPKFDTPKMELDFGSVRVGEAAERKFAIENKGIYDVTYKFILKNKAYRERFTISEIQGMLKAGEEKPISIRFKSKTGWEQQTTNDTTGLVLQIMEDKGGIERETIPIKVMVKAVYSIYSITPVKGINFGPLQYGENKTLSFEIKNEGKFDFNYVIYDSADNNARTEINKRRVEELEELGKVEEQAPVDPKGKKEQKKDVKKEAKKKEDKKTVAKTGKGKQAADLEGSIKVGQFNVMPATGDIAAGASTIIKVTFNAEGSKFYESCLGIDVSNRNYTEQPNGALYTLTAESCIPGINVEDLQSIFEEQTVLNSLDPGTNVQSVITKSIFASEENVFWFGTLVPSKDSKGQIEKFKISNPNKIPCTVKFAVKPRTTSKSEGFAFKVSPESMKIMPHEHNYVKVSFEPTNIMSYGGIFEAIVENGDPKEKSGKLRFELRGEGVLPSVILEKPANVGDDGNPTLRFKRTRVDKSQKDTIVLKNDGSVPATVQFEPIKAEVFNLVSPTAATILPKSYQSFELSFEPKDIGESKYVAAFSTVHNPYELQKVTLIGEAYREVVVFEGLPNNSEDELIFGDCPLDKVKKISFSMTSKSDKILRFEWLLHKQEVKCFPRVGFLKPNSSKTITFAFKAKDPIKIDNEEMWCRINEIIPAKEGEKINDWDESMTETKLVRPSELKIMQKKRLEEEKKRQDDAEYIVNQIVSQKAQAAALAAKAKPGDKKEIKKEVKKEIKKEIKKEAKKDAKKEVKKDAKGKIIEQVDEQDKIDENEQPTEEIEEPIKEPEITIVENTQKDISLKCTAISDYPKYECATQHIFFKPTLMYQTRSYKFSIKNTSLISYPYSCKVTDTENGIVNFGPYNILPRTGTIAPGCEESFIIKFSPTEAEDTSPRLLVISIPNLDPSQKPLVIEIDGSSERPVCHFELPPSKYREKKEKDMAPIDNKYSIIEFESLGTKIKNVKRFMVVNPTSQGYEFEWIENEEKAKTSPKSVFRCLTPKGTILSGKKFEMAFEYTPDTIGGTHESYWEFHIPEEKLVQHFLVVGQVLEPLVLFETSKVDFGPLLVGGKNRESVKLVNQEHIPFTFAFDPKSVKGLPEDGESLQVTPMSGVVDPQSSVTIEIMFIPKFEKAFNYNLMCKVKRKGRPLNINVKGVGYSLKHELYTDMSKPPLVPNTSQELDFGEFFIN